MKAKSSYFSRTQAEKAIKEFPALSEEQKNCIRNYGEDFWIVCDDRIGLLVRFIEDEG